MVAPTILPTLFADGFESGLLDGWTAGEDAGPAPALSIVGAPVHAGNWALDVHELQGSNIGYAQHTAAFNVDYLALDGWFDRLLVQNNCWGELRLTDVNGNRLRMRDTFGGGNQTGLWYNNAWQVGAGAQVGPYHEYRLEYNYALDSVRYWLDGADQGSVNGLGFGQPASIQCCSQGDNFNAQDVYFDDIVFSGVELLLWRKRKRNPWWFI